MSVKEQLKVDVELTAAAIQDNRRLVDEALEHSEAQRRRLEEIEYNTRKLLERGVFNHRPQVRRGLEQLMERCDRLRELRNMAELGAFQLQVRRVMQTAWEAMP